MTHARVWNATEQKSVACYVVCQMNVDDLDWLPPAGIHLDRDGLVVVITALRTLINGREPDEPKRAHAVTLSYVIADAIERTEGGP
jgi:hypothetical protein